MNLGMSDRVKSLVAQVRAMIRDEIAPLDEEYHAEIGKAGDRFVLTPRQIEIITGYFVVGRRSAPSYSLREGAAFGPGP